MTYQSNISSLKWMQADQSHCTNMSTTPITAKGCQQCLPLSVVQPKGKHCRKPHCCNGFVDMSRLGFSFLCQASCKAFIASYAQKSKSTYICKQGVTNNLNISYFLPTVLCARMSFVDYPNLDSIKTRHLNATMLLLCTITLVIQLVFLTDV